MSRALNGDILTPRRGSRHCQQYRPLSGIIGLSTMLWLFKCERTAVMTNRKEGPRSNPARRPASILLPKTCGIASCLFHHRPARSTLTPHIRFLSIGSHFCSALPSDPVSRRRPCASLTLHLHQVG